MAHAKCKPIKVQREVLVLQKKLFYYLILKPLQIEVYIYVSLVKKIETISRFGIK